MFVGGVRVGLDVLFFLTEKYICPLAAAFVPGTTPFPAPQLWWKRSQQWWRGLPKKINLMSACSGTGLFELCFHQVIEKINDRLFTSGEDRIQACLFQGICQP
jgi:hypothetical protein